MHIRKIFDAQVNFLVSSKATLAGLSKLSSSLKRPESTLHLVLMLPHSEINRHKEQLGVFCLKLLSFVVCRRAVDSLADSRLVAVRIILSHCPVPGNNSKGGTWFLREAHCAGVLHFKGGMQPAGHGRRAGCIPGKRSSRFYYFPFAERASGACILRILWRGHIFSPRAFNSALYGRACDCFGFEVLPSEMGFTTL